MKQLPVIISFMFAPKNKPRETLPYFCIYRGWV